VKFLEKKLEHSEESETQSLNNSREALEQQRGMMMEGMMLDFPSVP